MALPSRSSPVMEGEGLERLAPRALLPLSCRHHQSPRLRRKCSKRRCVVGGAGAVGPQPAAHACCLPMAFVAAYEGVGAVSAGAHVSLRCKAGPMPCEREPAVVCVFALYVL